MKCCPRDLATGPCSVTLKLVRLITQFSPGQSGLVWLIISGLRGAGRQLEWSEGREEEGEAAADTGVWVGSTPTIGRGTLSHSDHRLEPDSHIGESWIIESYTAPHLDTSHYWEEDWGEIWNLYNNYNKFKAFFSGILDINVEGLEWCIITRSRIFPIQDNKVVTAGQRPISKVWMIILFKKSENQNDSEK